MEELGECFKDDEPHRLRAGTTCGELVEEGGMRVHEDVAQPECCKHLHEVDVKQTAYMWRERRMRVVNLEQALRRERPRHGEETRRARRIAQFLGKLDGQQQLHRKLGPAWSTGKTWLGGQYMRVEGGRDGATLTSH